MIGHPPVAVQVSMCSPSLDTAGVSGEVIVTQLASRLAAADVLPVVEEPLRPRATSLLKPAVDKDLSMDNGAEGATGPLIFNHLVQIELLLHSLSQVQIFALGFDRTGYHAGEDL